MATRLDAREIAKLLPQRFPLQLVDRILDVEPLHWAEGVKLVSAQDAAIIGHFPGQAMLPGCILMETMLQVAGVAMHYGKPFGDEVALVASLDNVRFRIPVCVGDELRVHAAFTRMKGRVASMHCTGSVAGREACCCDCTVVFPKRPVLQA